MSRKISNRIIDSKYTDGAKAFALGMIPGVADSFVPGSGAVVSSSQSAYNSYKSKPSLTTLETKVNLLIEATQGIWTQPSVLGRLEELSPGSTRLLYESNLPKAGAKKNNRKKTRRKKTRRKKTRRKKTNRKKTNRKKTNRKKTNRKR